MAAVDLEAAPEVLKHYSIGTVKKIGPASFGLGEHGKALLVESDQGKYILKPLTTALYPELIDGARYEVSVVNELVRKGFPAAPLVATTKAKTASKEDRFLVEASNGKVYLLYRFIEGKSVSHEEMNRPQFNAFVDTLASFHQTLSAFKPAGKRSRPSITDFKVQKERLDQLKALLLRKQANAKTPLSRGEKFFLEQVDFILDQLSVLNLNLPPPVYKKLPKAKIDGDYHPGNAVFQGNRVLAVFDWDHLREEARIYDFFNEIFPNITSDKRFNVPALLRAVTRYEKTQPLNKAEKETLPEMARLKFLDLATWIVRPEKISERHQYDLSSIPPLEQAIAILDRNDHVFAWFQDNLTVLKDIDQQIRKGSFRIPRSEARSEKGGIPDQEPKEIRVRYALGEKGIHLDPSDSIVKILKELNRDYPDLVITVELALPDGKTTPPEIIKKLGYFAPDFNTVLKAFLLPQLPGHLYITYSGKGAETAKQKFETEVAERDLDTGAILETSLKPVSTVLSETRADYEALESRAKDLAAAFRRQKQVEQADEKLNELIRQWIQLTPPAQKVSLPEKGVLGFKNVENGFTFWQDLAASVQNSAFEQKTAALSALEALLTAAHIFYTQKAKQNEKNRGTRLFYYDQALQPL
ncbi:MAG TPA: phosphotransferase, partial [bacterium]|nr:phosphotransferase [bacterium]